MKMKSTRTNGILLCLFAILVLPVVCFSKPHSLSESQADEEVRIVVENILKYHPNPFHITSKEVFYREVSKLRSRRGEIGLTRQYFDLSHLLSMIFDVHTQLHVTGETPGFKSTFPLRFKTFGDGLFVVAASESYREAIGKKVVAISGIKIEKVINKISGHSSADSDIRKRVFTEMFLYMPETYDYFNLKTRDGKIQLQLVDDHGKNSEVELLKTWDKGLNDFTWDSLNPFIPDELITVHELSGKKMPYFLKNLRNNYWYEFIDEQKKFMYLQINFPYRKKGGVLPTDFHLNWSRDLWKSKAEVLIIDLRNNPGGSISLGNPIPGILSTLFHEHPTLKGVAVLVGTDTVSAGVVLAAQLEDAIAPIFIGEPTGSSPNLFLQAKTIDLPYSKIRFEVSTDVYIITRELDKRRFLAPDIPMSLTFVDYANGRDPLIEKAKTVNKKMRKDIYGTASAYQPWFRETQKKAVRQR